MSEEHHPIGCLLFLFLTLLLVFIFLAGVMVGRGVS
jgi:hypothetical protein